MKAISELAGLQVWLILAHFCVISMARTVWYIFLKFHRDRIQRPGEVVETGQEVEVKVVSIDRDKKRIGLSLRQLQEDPWVDRIAKYEVGQLQGGVARV